jgi:hypothetical protein
MQAKGSTAGLALATGAVLWAAAGAPPAPNAGQGPTTEYDRWFTDAAMRVDLLHTGDGSEASYSLDEVVREPLWPGTRTHLIDPFGRGTHRFRVRDLETGTEIFRLGYATLFDEWTGTEEALAGVERSMSESVRFPWPRRPVVLHLERRRRDGSFEDVFGLAIDPASHLIDRSVPFGDVEVLDLGGGPAPSEAMDVVIVPEGYTRRDRAKMRADMSRFARVLLESEPFASHHARIHVRGVLAYSRERGPDEPRKGLFRDTLLESSFNTFDSPRYLTVTHTKTLRQVAARAPYDVILVLVDTGRYGGGGVYNQWAVFVSDNEYDEYVMLHELGHHMAGLGDEYYSSAVSTDEDLMYPEGVEPWEPNLTAMLDGGRRSVKWSEMIDPQTPVPTPERDEYADVVGTFEGAGYKAEGLFRPQLDCKMFDKGLVGYCQVCARAIVDMMRYYAGEEIP